MPLQSGVTSTATFGQRLVVHEKATTDSFNLLKMTLDKAVERMPA